ncbi:D-2-hydroxyglutarate dehydrogenase, mitochondrial [Venturia canescens]|uniref:D-2-hydroxyglutarate dehydrogenase, mitochondrial n=1 Tax=Venturia canescens TaxID=32260 RepID=UPI001C9C897F|nr:D-2-hydroxyglutarate dehydrogenase, mitochondrial [Venturia canescens]XP_043286113.1 D-2-hydroxyglutarate dehydrogenase, mitochondrial [Venturia canescens]
MGLQRILKLCNHAGETTFLQNGKKLLTVVRNASTNAKPDLTSVRYKIERGPYATLNEAHLQFFKNTLDDNRVITDPEECESYNVDWIKMVRGNSRLVLKPKTTEEVSKILKYCNENRLAVCPQSGNTGLVGGSVPVFDEIVLSMKLMDRIISTDELSGSVACEAGCVLESLETHLAQYGLMMPLDLGAKGSCLIGGNISTNAGGLRLLRYGNLHGNVLGIEAVKANGEVIDCMNTLKKDNTGYHIKNLFIGSEGTLGVVTKVAIQCPTKALSTNVAFLGLTDYENVLKVVRLAKRELAEILSSCELMDKESLDATTGNLGLRSPLSGEAHNFYMLIETAGSKQTHDEEKLSSFVEKALSDGLIEDGTMTGEPAKIKNIWDLRERVAEGVMRDGYCFKYDVSLPLSHFYEIIELLRERLTNLNVVRINGFGHLGDGNLHVSVSTKAYDAEVEDKLEPFIFEFVSKLRGSVSSEHGIGFKKAKYLRLSKEPGAIALMHQIKRMMDPNGILNPYKVVYPM